MDVIERLNRRFGAWYEGLFGTSSDRDLRPRDILRRLLAAMEDARREGLDGQIYVPNVYTLQISVADDDERDYLKTFLSAEDLAAAVRRAIEQHGYRLKGGLSFQVEEAPAGTVDRNAKVVIRTRFDASVPLEEKAKSPAPAPIPVSKDLAAAGPVQRRTPAPTTMTDEDDDEPGTVIGLPAQILASLIARGTDGQLQEVYPIGPRGARIGRSRKSGNDIVLNDGMISKRHAAVVYEPELGRFSVRDEGSTNGTRVNGTNLPAGSSVALKPGDQILLGETVLTFRPTDDFSRERSAPQAAAPSAPPAAFAASFAAAPIVLLTEDGVSHPIASEMAVGRSLTSDLALSGGGIASEHARLFRQPAPIPGGEDRIYVEDLGSAGGTFVNGERIPSHFPVAIYDGDSLAFGEVPLRVARRGASGGV